MLLKFKAWVIETWLARELGGQSYRHALGYNVDEQSRIAKSERAFAGREPEPVRVAFGFNCDEESRIARAAKYDTELRQGFYPLASWQWSRERCLEYLKAMTGETWRKSACNLLPVQRAEGRRPGADAQFPERIAEALMLEYQSLALNPRGTLYRDRTLHSIIVGDHHIEALQHFQKRLEAAEYALYRVRRIYRAPGQADRAVEKLMTGSRAEMGGIFDEASTHLSVRVEHDIRYGYVREREADRYPTTEEFFVVAPATIESKTRHGFEWFEARWREALGETGQERLFN